MAPQTKGPLFQFVGKLDNGVELLIDLPGDREALEQPRIPQSALDHVKAVPRKLKNITSLDGLAAAVRRVEMTGINHVEKVNVIYYQNGQEITRAYAVDQFYKL